MIEFINLKELSTAESINVENAEKRWLAFCEVFLSWRNCKTVGQLADLRSNLAQMMLGLNVSIQEGSEEFERLRVVLGDDTTTYNQIVKYRVVRCAEAIHDMQKIIQHNIQES